MHPSEPSPSSDAPWPEVPVWAEPQLPEQPPSPLPDCPRDAGRQERFQALIAPGGPVLWEEDHRGLQEALRNLGITREEDLGAFLQREPEALASLLATIRVPTPLGGCPARCPMQAGQASPWPCLLGDRALDVFREFLRAHLRQPGTFRTDLSLPGYEGGWRTLHVALQPSVRPGWFLASLAEAPSRTRRGRLKAALAMLQRQGWTATSPGAILQGLEEALAACALPSQFLALVRDRRRGRIWTWISPGSRLRQDEVARQEAEEAANQVLHGLPCQLPERACRLGLPQAALGALILDPDPAFLRAEDLHTFRLLGGLAAHLLQELLASRGLARSQALLMQTQSMADLGSVEVEIPEHMVLWSPQARRIWGLVGDETFTGYRDLLERIHPEDLPEVRATVAVWRRSDEGLDLRFRLLLPGGELRWVATKGHLERNEEGRVDKYLLTFQDITAATLQTRRLEAQEARFRHEAEVKSMLLQEVNHRVKNNLTGILGMLDMEQRAAHLRPGGTADAMEDLKQRIFALARVHELLSAEEWGPLRLDHLVDDIIRNTMAATTAARTVHLELTCTGGPWRISPGTATPLAMILAELTTNAVKYAFAGRPSGCLQVLLEPEAPASPRLRLTFQDDGPGFPPGVHDGSVDHVGLRLIRHSARNLLKGEISMDNEGGARILLLFQPSATPGNP